MATPNGVLAARPVSGSRRAWRRQRMKLRLCWDALRANWTRAGSARSFFPRGGVCAVRTRVFLPLDAIARTLLIVSPGSTCAKAETALDISWLLGGQSLLTGYLWYLSTLADPPKCGCLGLTGMFNSSKHEALFGVFRNCVILGALKLSFDHHFKPEQTAAEPVQV